MRIENGERVPSTLGEYLDICMILGGKDCEAVEFLEKRISLTSRGRDEQVIVADSQMRLILLPMLLGKKYNGSVFLK